MTFRLSDDSIFCVLMSCPTINASYRNFRNVPLTNSRRCGFLISIASVSIPSISVWIPKATLRVPRAATRGPFPLNYPFRDPLQFLLSRFSRVEPRFPPQFVCLILPGKLCEREKKRNGTKKKTHSRRIGCLRLTFNFIEFTPTARALLISAFIASLCLWDVIMALGRSAVMMQLARTAA